MLKLEDRDTCLPWAAVSCALGIFFQVCKLLTVNLPILPGANSGVKSALDKSAYAMMECSPHSSCFSCLRPLTLLVRRQQLWRRWPQVVLLLLALWDPAPWEVALWVVCTGLGRRDVVMHRFKGWWPLGNRLKDVGSHPATKSGSLPASRAVGSDAGTSPAVPQPAPRRDNCRAHAYFGPKDSVVAGTFSKPLFFVE